MGNRKIPAVEGRNLLRDIVKNLTSWEQDLTKISSNARAYYLKIIKNEGSLWNPPRISINTIHAVKGGEADYVAVRPDMTRRTYEGSLDNPDSEGRVFYVAATRAKKGLWLAFPASYYAFDYGKRQRI
jgi:superfamily I DNA/RNA helicase